MRKIFALSLILVVLLTLCSCKSDKSTDVPDKSAETSVMDEEHTQTIGKVSVVVPDGWECDKNVTEAEHHSFFVRVSGTSKYLWIRPTTTDRAKELIASADENYISPFDTNDIHWTGKETIISTTIDNTVLVVVSSDCDFADETVLQILGSLKIIGKLVIK